MGKLGRSTISSTDSLHVPKGVMNYFELVRGDELHWYPPEEEFQATAEFLAVKIIRFGERTATPTTSKTSSKPTA